ncbi:ROK family protein [Streptomyces sp. 4503]|uniref:ROK family protein n=1 Tax=Streptomyces niphimycinicus TaxID=2842201 RepID=A0ABS6CRP8_9ACTN|nr:ROK family protein [Streptomyces niphimycinicus]MBU3869632.1 ROK family protein [Streptomyces niphimycinicus]
MPVIPEGNAHLLRRLNLAATVRAFLDSTSLTVSDVGSTVGVSRPSAEELVATLLNQRFVRESLGRPNGERSAGRPARRYEVVAENFAVVGVGIGAHKVAVVVCDLRGDVVAMRRRGVDSGLGPAGRIGAAARLVEATVRQTGTSREHIRSVACGITGVAANGSEANDMRTAPAGRDLDVYSLLGFDKIDVVSEVSRRFKRDVLVSNDIHLAAAAEQWRGAAAEARDLVYVHAGRRLGAAIVINGQIHNGRRGLAASVGSMKILGWADAMAQLMHHRRLARDYEPHPHRSEGVNPKVCRRASRRRIRGFVVKSRGQRDGSGWTKPGWARSHDWSEWLRRTVSPPNGRCVTRLARSQVSSSTFRNVSS